MYDSDLFDKAVEIVGGKYLLTNLISLRIRQLKDGSDPMINPEGLGEVDIVLTEIVEGLLAPRRAEVAPGAEDLFSSVTADEGADEESDEDESD